METKVRERYFSMAAFLAFIELRSYLQQHPEISTNEAISVVKKIRADSTNLDFQGGIVLFEVLDNNLDWNQTQPGLRLFVHELVKFSKPWWLRLVPYGREKMKTSLSNDTLQCFREAGLFESTPNHETVKWWDKLASLVRSEIESEKMINARYAERLSLQFEITRLEQLGVKKKPIWVSLEDNTLGYDVLSYDLSGEHVINRLIEVKSTTSNTIFITRNEWDNATGSSDNTLFHVWQLPNEVLHEFTVKAIEPHIPNDQGSGVWKDVEISLRI